MVTDPSGEGGTSMEITGNASIGTTGVFASPGYELPSPAVPRLTSMPLSTPLPWARAGERDCSETFSTRVGMAAGIFGPEIVISTQPDTEKKKKSTCPQALPWT